MKEKKKVDCSLIRFIVFYINVRENRRGNQEWTIQRNWQHCVNKTQNEDKQNKNTIQKTKKMSNTNHTTNWGSTQAPA